MDEVVAAAYQRCRELHRTHGRSYYLATHLLPADSRRHVHALYGFTRTADDLVDDAAVADPAGSLARLGERLHAGLREPAAVRDDPVLPALVRTVGELGLDTGQLDRFLASMAMDLTVTRYEDYDDLLVYMDGSAAVIGEMMLPLLEPARPDAALGPARDLGIAFQLTNFLRDVAEDLDRGRVYLPQEDLARFGADPHRRRVDDPWRQLVAFEIARCRELYRSADAGIALLPPASARCIRTARVLYAGILDRIEQAGYDVFTGRARVPTWRKLATAAGAMVRRRPARSRADRPTPTGR